MPRTFFDEKQSWSTLKDRILGSYIVPYLTKVKRLGNPIVLVDAFAGPGRYRDGTDGSPLILLNAAQEQVPRRYVAIFVNASRAHHDSLSRLVQTDIDAGAVRCVRATAKAVLTQLGQLLGEQTLLIYLDPFGIKEFDLGTLEPYLKRRASTELLITLQTPILHRLAARRALASGLVNPRILAFHRRLDATFGGYYWRPVLLSDHPASSREGAMMRAFAARLRAIVPASYCGWCPVSDKEQGHAKYYFLFWSTHPDALILMNDIMLIACREHLHEQEVKGTLFEGEELHESPRSAAGLDRLITAQVQATPGLSRKSTWTRILESHFRVYSRSEYRSVVKRLVDQGVLRYEDAKGTRRLNDASRLFPVT